MISALEWIPRGIANPTPPKYEWSRAEKEFLEKAKREEAEGGEKEEEEEEEGEDSAEEMDEDGDGGDDDSDNDSGDRPSSSSTLPKIDPNSLPPEYRMDDYSDDDDDEANAARIGELLVGKATEVVGTHTDADGRPAFDEDEDNNSNSSSNSNDDDKIYDSDEDDENLADVPDTREFEPTSVDGLASMGLMGDLSGAGGGTEDVDDLDDEDDDQSDGGSEADDVNLRPNDALLIVAKAEDDFASLEINVYDTDDGNLYVHHDLPLPSYPLCLARGDVGPGGLPGNFVAVGSFDRGIEVWNLDVLHALEPACVLGGEHNVSDGWMNMDDKPTNKKKNKKNKNKNKAQPKTQFNGLKEGSHDGAVMGLSWNPVHRNVLASSSADTTVKLWDVARAGGGDNNDAYARPSATLTHHTDKVPCVAWHPGEGTILATGGYDRTLCVVDARDPSSFSSAKSVKSVRLSADCEAVKWDPHNAHLLTAAAEDGTVKTWDVRKFGSSSPPVWAFEPHGGGEFGGANDVSYNSCVPGLLATCATDGTVALWDCREASPTRSPEPCLVAPKDMGAGKLYAVSFYPSDPWLLSCGGSGNELAVWDMRGEEAVRSRFEKGTTGSHVGVGVGNQEDAGSEGAKDVETDFEEVMMKAADDDATTKADNEGKSKKKKGGKKKKKVHRRGGK